jgi:hypothetical protein
VARWFIPPIQAPNISANSFEQLEIAVAKSTQNNYELDFDSLKASLYSGNILSQVKTNSNTSLSRSIRTGKSSLVTTLLSVIMEST